MSGVLTPGPVFVYESIAASRRWQPYALRALLVGCLLGSLWLAWYSARPDEATRGEDLTRALAAVGEAFYTGAAGIEVALAFLVAPAASAGSICVDRTRGWLTHAFVTDLSDAEIVLGKLASRYVSAAGIVLTGLPVFLLATLLGGIVPEALIVLAAVTLLVLLLGCWLSMAVSARAGRTHEVLMIVFGIWAAWLFGPTAWRAVAEPIGYPLPPPWFERLNPFFLVFAPYTSPGSPIVGDLALFAAICVLLSAAAIVFTVRSLRGGAADSPSLFRRIDAALDRAQARLFSRWPTPSLDENPVLWREWRLSKPAWYSRAIFIGCATALAASVGVGLYEMLWLGNGWRSGMSNPFVEWVSILAALLGLLLLGASAPTSLAEERLRGSLDLLMGTPLSTREIVLGKWRASFRRVFPFLTFTALAGPFIAVTAPTSQGYDHSYFGHSGAFGLTLLDRGLAAIFPSAFLLAHGAAISGLGLLFATWIRRTGRAVAACVTTVVLFSAGWSLFGAAAVESAASWVTGTDSFSVRDEIRTFAEPTAALSPVDGQTAPYGALASVTYDFSRGDFHPRRGRRIDFWVGLLRTLAVIVLFAAGVIGLTLLTFNRSMGRMSESGPWRWRPRREGTSDAPGLSSCRDGPGDP